VKTREDFIRPSALTAIADCPAAPAMQAEYVNRFGEPPAADEAETGTQVHSFVAVAIEAWKAGEEWGQAIAGACNAAAANAGLDRWSVLCIQRCAEFARFLITKHEVQPENVLVEHTLDMVATGFRRGGTADLVIVVPFFRVIVIDWKAGYLDQGEAADHDQIAAYADAAAATFSAPVVTVYLYQPRADKPLRVSGATFDTAVLAKGRAWRLAVTARARVDDPELGPSFAACKHCRALPRCAAAKEWFMRLIEALQVLGDPQDADAWGDLISASKVSEKAAELGIEAGKRHLSAGGSATGWHLQSGGLQTRIDAAKAIEIAREGGFLEDLLQFASFKVEAAKALDIAGAISAVPKSPSLKPARTNAAA
jgi:hypothetical protein